jgi:hypothetical protein
VPGSGADAAIAALPDREGESPRAVLGAVAAGIAAHVQAESETCRVLMEAPALAAHEPVIAAAVRATDREMGQWHLAPGSFSWSAAAAALAEGPAPGTAHIRVATAAGGE